MKVLPALLSRRMDATTDQLGPVVDSAGRVVRLAASVCVSDIHIPGVLLLLYGRVFKQQPLPRAGFAFRRFGGRESDTLIHTRFGVYGFTVLYDSNDVSPHINHQSSPSHA